MARYRGPACRVCRRHGEKLMLKGARCFTPKCSVAQRHSPPGQHGTARRKVSEYSLQLKEKQKARHIYGVLERQFRRHFAEAERRPGLSGENLLQILETRLDNVVYRLGFADSRRQARQLVLHGHITLNGRLTNIPSCQVKSGDVIAWKEGSTKTVPYQLAVQEIESKVLPGWLSLDRGNMSGQVLSIPSREEIETTIDERLIVAFYSR
ncbi:MAG: 30S ribosomal protein S4 [Dehalococcoidia bacterium]|nr:MAG: 30S ribosomal protein S4 [Dehalococcoidia bacterium]UCG84509.1 MAG: 30S ribosomal protein S4 [Dehalococcoidia bacterium]